MPSSGTATHRCQQYRQFISDSALAGLNYRLQTITPQNDYISYYLLAFFQIAHRRISIWSDKRDGIRSRISFETAAWRTLSTADKSTTQSIRGLSKRNLLMAGAANNKRLNLQNTTNAVESIWWFERSGKVPIPHELTCRKLSAKSEMQCHCWLTSITQFKLLVLAYHSKIPTYSLRSDK